MLSISACTVLCPTVGVIRGSIDADVITDEHGCEHAPDGTVRVPCTHPGPVRYGGTIVTNALVGLLIDAAFIGVLRATSPNFTSDNIFQP